MSKWWYYTIHKCPGCGATYDEYDASAPWYDSGLHGSPVIDDECDECFEERRQADLMENL